MADTGKTSSCGEGCVGGLKGPRESGATTGAIGKIQDRLLLYSA